MYTCTYKHYLNYVNKKGSPHIFAFFLLERFRQDDKQRLTRPTLFTLLVKSLVAENYVLCLTHTPVEAIYNVKLCESVGMNFFGYAPIPVQFLHKKVIKS